MSNFANVKENKPANGTQPYNYRQSPRRNLSKLTASTVQPDSSGIHATSALLASLDKSILQIR